MIRMRIKSIIVGGGPIPSGIILRPARDEEGNAYNRESFEAEHKADDLYGSSCFNELPISMGTVDAACIARSVDGGNRTRPMTHELLWNTIEVLGGMLESVSIRRVEQTTFFATLDVTDANGIPHHIDARPSDALALAVRAHVPILADEMVLEQGGMPDFEAIAKDERAREMSEFHDFVESLSPADFKASDTL